MSKCIAILQPGYLPWLGYFEQLARVDEFVHLDDVQFTRRDWRSRNRIKGPAGVQWLTVPVQVRGRFMQRVDEARIADERWQPKHLRTLHFCYQQAEHFDTWYPRLARIIEQPWERMIDLCLAVTREIADGLKIATPVRMASELNLPNDAVKSTRILRICQELGATEYYSGAAARDYLDVSAFGKAGIRVEFQDYAHPTYRQLWGPFVSHLSSVDLLMNEGPRAREVLMQGAAELASQTSESRYT